MGGQARHKGTGVMAIVAGLAAIEGIRDHLPGSLHRYLDDPIMPSGWYPEDDYHALLLALVKHVDRAPFKGRDVWEAFGRMGARRDVGGDQGASTIKMRTAGIYQRFALDHDAGLHELFARVPKLWDQYHDSGSLVCLHDPAWGPRVRSRLTGFGFPDPGMMRLQLGYLLEYAACSNIPVKGRVLAFGGASGERPHEWEYEVVDSPQNLASLARLPRPE